MIGWLLLLIDMRTPPTHYFLKSCWRAACTKTHRVDPSPSMQPSSTSRNHVKRPATPASQGVQLYYDHSIILSQWRKCCIASNSFLTAQHIGYKSCFSWEVNYTNTGNGIRFRWLGVSQVTNDIIAKNNYCFDLRSYHKSLRLSKVKCFIIIGRNEW